jgi:hypothetical protein
MASCLNSILTMNCIVAGGHAQMGRASAPEMKDQSRTGTRNTEALATGFLPARNGEGNV